MVTSHCRDALLQKIAEAEQAITEGRKTIGGIPGEGVGCMPG